MVVVMKVRGGDDRQWGGVAVSVLGGGRRSPMTLSARFLPYFGGRLSRMREEMMGKPSNAAAPVEGGVVRWWQGELRQPPSIVVLPIFGSRSIRGREGRVEGILGWCWV